MRSSLKHFISWKTNNWQKKIKCKEMVKLCVPWWNSRLRSLKIFQFTVIWVLPKTMTYVQFYVSGAFSFSTYLENHQFGLSAQLELQIIRQTYLCTNRTSLITPTILTTPHCGQSRNYRHTEQNNHSKSVKNLELKLIRNIVCSQRKQSCSEMNL